MYLILPTALGNRRCYHRYFADEVIGGSERSTGQAKWLRGQTRLSSHCLALCSPETHFRNTVMSEPSHSGRSAKSLSAQHCALTPVLGSSWHVTSPALQGGHVPRYPWYLMTACRPNHPVKLRANKGRDEIIAESTT